MMNEQEIGIRLEEQRPNYCLEQDFYIDEGLWQFERRGWLSDQWYVIGHISELTKPKSYIVRELLGESIIVTRAADGVLRAFYNVCRHRGSRLCESDGQRDFLLCPYHAWSFELDGRLRRAPTMDNLDKASHGLKALSVVEVAGVILASPSGDPALIAPWVEEQSEMLAHYGIPSARIAARRSYPTKANWKLVMENFTECYHCLPAHPEYASVMAHVDVFSRDDAAAAARWQNEVDQWREELADFSDPLRGRGRFPIGRNRLGQTQSGVPAAPLMGKQERFDGSVGGGTGLEPFVFLMTLNDHAVLFRFIPMAAELTDVEILWLVDRAAADEAIDLPALMWLWDVTTIQDKQIIERNAAGVHSLAYRPGPYSKLEGWTSSLIAHYLDGMKAKLTDKYSCVQPRWIDELTIG